MCNGSQTEIVRQVEFKSLAFFFEVLTQYMKGKFSVKSGHIVAYKKTHKFLCMKSRKTNC